MEPGIIKGSVADTSTEIKYHYDGIVVRFEGSYFHATFTGDSFHEGLTS